MSHQSHSAKDAT